MRIDLAGLRMSDGTPDSDGSLWYVEEWEGWDSANLTQSLGALTTRHGSTLLESRYESRTVILRGVCKATSEEAYWRAYYRITGGLVSLQEPRPLTVHETVPKTVDVVLGAPPRVTSVGVGAFRFEITLVATNPLKRGAVRTVTVPAGVTTHVFNNGNFYAYPRVTAGGSVNLLNSLNTLRLLTRTNVPNGTVFDAWTRTVYNGTTNLYNNLATTSQWLVLQPGDNPVQNTGSSSATLEYADPYI